MDKMVILLKYVKRTYKIERELHKMGLKNRFKGLKLEGSPLFIDTIDKSWSSDENNSDTQDCAMW